MSTSLDISENSVDEVLVVSLTGTLDGHTYMELESFLSAKLESNIKRFVIVLKEVTYIASAGVGVLINYMKQCKGQEGALEVAEPSKSVSEVLQILGLDALMTLHTDTNNAVEAAKG